MNVDALTDKPADNWAVAPNGDVRGYIDPHALQELWFHTGTACNLACPFCLEGSKPGDDRLDRMSLTDVEGLMEEAVELGVEQFSFTGGEPFIVKDFVNILRFAAARKPCLVLTNGTDVVQKRLHQIATLADTPYPISFRISIDWPDAERHEVGRGEGTFAQSLNCIVELQKLGFQVSVARQMEPDEDTDQVEAAYQQLLTDAGYTGDVRLVAFPDFSLPGDNPDVPVVTEDCMTRYQTEQTRRAFMCAFSKMVIKQNGRMRVYACTLVDDDLRYDQGSNLRAALSQRVMLAHHRCYSCFAYGSSCSER